LRARTNETELGGWKLEAIGDRIAIGGKKLYTIYNKIDLAERGEAIKKASKGVRLTPQEIIAVCNGQEVVYQNPVPHFSLDGSADFVDELNTPRLCVENPIIHCHAAERIGRRQDQIIQPWQFGHGETKATCLWLKGLPKLKPSNIVSGRTPRVHYASPSPDRWKERSKTLSGIADAMAEQWGAN
jgi:hypothetical protein